LTGALALKLADDSRTNKRVGQENKNVEEEQALRTRPLRHNGRLGVQELALLSSKIPGSATRISERTKRSIFESSGRRAGWGD